MKILTIVLLAISLMFGAVDINSASKKELSGLNGIGAKKADTIISYRETHCFKSIMNSQM